MKLKSLLFGSAAAFATVTGAQAADLPIAEPVEYVRICDAFGSGYYYIPGTETCLKISGFVRFDMYYTPGHDDDDDDIDLFGNESERYNNFATRARGAVRFDARTQTDLGILRSYIAYEATHGPTNTGFYGTGLAELDQAFIQLLMDSGTLTAGRADSFFDYEVSNAWNTPRGGDDDPYTSVNLLAYTFAFGNGFSATLSLEDSRSSERRALDASDLDLFFGKKVVGFNDDKDFLVGNEMPDFVANVRIDQGWGSAQIAGAVGKVELASFDDDDDDDSIWGWAVSAGATFEVPNTAFEAGLTARYADGLVSYITTGNRAGFVDAFYDYDGDAEGATAWAVEGSIKAGISDNGWIALSGTYAHYDLDGGFAVSDCVGLVCDSFGEVDYEFDTWTAALTGGVDIVPGLFVGAELAYEHTEINGDYTVIEDFDDDDDGSFDVDDDIWSIAFRLQRNF